MPRRSASPSAAVSPSARTPPIAARRSSSSDGARPSDKLASEIASDGPRDVTAALGPTEQRLGEMEAALHVQPWWQRRLVRVDHGLDQAGTGRRQRVAQLSGA